ncbi:MAG: GGDEF domain-containing protein [Gammaproteobacteria bacterium]|nr:MAG: GGDEF domain-containing protein [Gammaproteobacteria bacterium]
MKQIKLEEEITRLTQQIEEYQLRMNELKQRSDIQDALNEILNISLMPVSLAEQMEKILVLVLDIPWLSLDKKGCVFLAGETGDSLKMVAHHNLNDSLLGLCSQIRFGQCLCGKAAATQELIFRDHVDHDHDIRPEGMRPHGHYNMPIVSHGKTLGVLNLYVREGHEQSQLEHGFLVACAKAMASIIERKRIEEQLHTLSYMDELTGIANRRSFMQHLDQIIDDAYLNSHMFAVLFIDLDYFKAVNDNHGHEYGDQVLVEAVDRIKACLRQTDFIARLGGDEFVAVLELVSGAEKALEVARQVISAVSQPYSLSGTVLNIGASVGVSLYPEHSKYSESLLRMADTALYQAKDSRGEAILYRP